MRGLKIHHVIGVSIGAFGIAIGVWNMNATWFDILQKLIASFAFLVGGFWVLMNYLRNRTHVPRLQVEVKAELVKRGDRYFLLATCQAKNVGLSIIRLPSPERKGEGLPGTAVLVKMLPPFDPEPHIFEVPWDDEPTVFDIFANHQFIEPGLTISEQKLIYQSDPRYVASQVQLRVSAHNEKWSAIAVAILEDDLGKPVSPLQGE